MANSFSRRQTVDKYNILLANVAIFQILKTFEIHYNQEDSLSDAGLEFFINLQLHQKPHPTQELGLSTSRKNDEKHAANWCFCLCLCPFFAVFFLF